jgi:ABC-type phosphate/phosphonate transport system substrate-binding protein
MFSQRICAGFAALTLGLIAFSAIAQEEKVTPDPVRIGLVRSFLRDLPPPMVQLMMQPFSALMKAQTGLNGVLVPCRDAFDLGRQLHEDKTQLGVFNGFEFAWAHQKYPDLKPLCIVINRQRHLTANLVVRDDSDISSLADLKGKVVGVARYSPAHCRLYLNRLTREVDAEPKQFFAKVVVPANVEDTLDDVLRGKLQAAVVDGVSLECYQQVKAACFARLKVLKKSEVFPAAVVACREGTLNAEALTRFREGMVSANQNERGRDLMSMWKITAFENVPPDYEATLASIAQAYPAATWQYVGVGNANTSE